MKYLFIMFVTLASTKIFAADNLVIVSIDGLRWQEVFRGYQDDVLNLADFKKQKEQLTVEFGGETKQIKRSKLMPFLWDSIAKNGILLGNRDLNSNMSLTNDMWFSYPGYNELLTGKADPNIDSNKAIPNPNVTILEWLNQQPSYQGKVAAFGSWDVFPAIINRGRSGLPINAGFESANWPNLSEKAKWLNQLQKQIPSPWHNVRLDAFTSGFAFEYIDAHLPKVIYLALGETDDYAHQGNYPEYLKGARRSDQIIENLWQQLQQIPQYKNNTNLVITVDHGRGENAETWQHHASPKAVKGYLNGLNKYPEGIVGAEQVWFAAIGPNIKNKGEVSGGENHQLNQVAATALQLLDFEYPSYAKDMGKPLSVIKR
ncbi:alkaline phosphatase family protein [Paraglaciecola aquimarina]|uniref:Alkaline phosphatase family protein n=1 Tax=Paraglaciecola algarum TaxID=3050085 RepID=A0ABS9D4N0_9ALTE|nr:alkaline phosphatase family protein [Paraglaciecola sp. G1-23]MCF2947883.1 alkaline phosphatase family protein [Paraglaciecola sp. G1-23]